MTAFQERMIYGGAGVLFSIRILALILPGESVEMMLVKFLLCLGMNFGVAIWAMKKYGVDEEARSTPFATGLMEGTCGGLIFTLIVKNTPLNGWLDTAGFLEGSAVTIGLLLGSIVAVILLRKGYQKWRA